MSFFSLATALIPLAIYLIYLGLINLSSKPQIVTGTVDSVALSIGISGLVIVGPMQLLLPHAAMVRFGDNVWYPMVLLYLFGVMWLLLLNRPRLIVYNIQTDVFQRLLETIMAHNNWGAYQSENILRIPEIGVELEILSIKEMKNITLRPVRFEQSSRGWQRLRKELSIVLEKQPTCHRGLGAMLLFFGLMVGSIGCAYLCSS